MTPLEIEIALLQAQVASLQREAHTWSSTLRKVLKEHAAEPSEQRALADHINAMCGWAETLAAKVGWERGNAGSFWTSYDAARAVAANVLNGRDQP
jgi:hypothetical protein